MKDTWCPTCSKPVRVSLDCFPALCGDCRQPYFVAQKPGGYAQGRADVQAEIVAWLRNPDTEWRIGDVIANRIERGEYEKKPDQCMDCGAFIVGAHGCQGIPGDEEGT